MSLTNLTPLQTSLWGSGTPAPGAELGRFEPLDHSSSILYTPGWLSGSDQLFDRLLTDIEWRSQERAMYDRIVAVPRLISTVLMSDLDPDHPLVAVGDQLGVALATDFAQIGVNLYRNGADSVAWHRDKVGHRAASTTVALVSLGSPRTLRMRPFGASRSGPTRTWHLGAGDLFVMAGACQLHWEHCVSKTKVAGPRISLAFRSTQ